MASNVGFIMMRPHLLKDKRFVEEMWDGMLIAMETVTAFKPVIIYLDSYSEISSSERDAIEQLQVISTDKLVLEHPHITSCFNNLQWLQLWTAGADYVIKKYKDKPKPAYMLTRNEGFFDDQMCQMAVSWMCARERNFEAYRSQQRLKVWKELKYRSMDEVTVGIVGFGSVGRLLAKMCTDWDMKVVALVKGGSQKHETTKDKNNDDKDIRTTTELSDLLSSSDYVISILPSITQTDGFFDGDVLKQCAPKKSSFINIGRGNVVTEETILRALDNKWISHALLDVFPVEPLPSGSSLWSRDDVSIMPHVSGRKFISHKFMKIFEGKYQKFMQGSEVTGKVDWDKMY